MWDVRTTQLRLEGEVYVTRPVRRTAHFSPQPIGAQKPVATRDAGTNMARHRNYCGKLSSENPLRKSHFNRRRERTPHRVFALSLYNCAIYIIVEHVVGISRRRPLGRPAQRALRAAIVHARRAVRPHLGWPGGAAANGRLSRADGWISVWRFM